MICLLSNEKKENTETTLKCLGIKKCGIEEKVIKIPPNYINIFNIHR